MHKTDGAGHLGNMFVAEDPLLNRAPTEITADWLNAVQIELANVIEWAGLTLSKADNGQLLQALQAKFASINPAGDYAVKAAVQMDDYKVADADVVGAANAIVAAFFPAITALASAHGMTLYVRALAANTSTTPTFTPNNGTIAAKTIVKGNNLPLEAGDILGAGFWTELRYDLAWDKWVLMNPATGIAPVVNDAGLIIPFGGVTPPAGYLACPTSSTNLSRTTYSRLFAAIGTTWGVGDGASTFGMPWFPADYAMVQGGTVGTSTVGQVISHSHNFPTLQGGAGNGADAYGGALIELGPTITVSNTGGVANLAAGLRVKFCVKY